MSSLPSVGIVTRTKNRGVLLRRALESITNQSFKNWKLVIVNDGGDPEIVDKLVDMHSLFSDKIEVIHKASSVGMEAASNIGLKNLNTDYAVIHDDDDSWSPEFLNRSIMILKEEQKKLPSIAGIATYTNKVIETVKGNSVVIEHTEPFNHWIKPGLILLDRMLYDNMFPPISFIFSLDACKELGYFNEELPVLGDWDFHIRFLLQHDIWMLPEPMAFYHHRMNATGALGNTIYAGYDTHMAYRNLLLNQWLRDDLSGKGNGLGIYINQRINTEHLLLNTNKIHSIEDISHRIEANTYRIEDINHRIEDNTYRIEDNTYRIEDISHRIEAKTHRIEDNTCRVEKNTIRIIMFIDKLKAKIKNPFRKVGD